MTEKKKIGRPVKYRTIEERRAADAKAKRDQRARKKAERERIGSVADTVPAGAGQVDATVVRPTVVEEAPPPLDIPAPTHPSGSSVPEAGHESGPAAALTPTTPSATAVATKPEAELVKLDPQTMTSLIKGVFAIAALRGGEHWKVTDEEVEPIAEPMCRQAMRIPVLAALGQDAADVILIGSTMGALIFLRVQESVERSRAEKAARERRGQIRELRPAAGETVRNADVEAGTVVQEVREPREPKPNLDMFAATT